MRRITDWPGRTGGGGLLDADAQYTEIDYDGLGLPLSTITKLIGTDVQKLTYTREASGPWERDPIAQALAMPELRRFTAGFIMQESGSAENDPDAALKSLGPLL